MRHRLTIFAFAVGACLAGATGASHAGQGHGFARHAGSSATEARDARPREVCTYQRTLAGFPARWVIKKVCVTR